MLDEAGCDLLWMPSVYRHLSRWLFDQGQRVRHLASGGKARRGPAISMASRRSSPSCCYPSGPTLPLFGEKDFQQLAVIRRMVARPRSSSRDRRRPDRTRAGRPRPVLAQCLSLAPTSDSRLSPYRGRWKPRETRSLAARRSRRLCTRLKPRFATRVFADRLFRACRCRRRSSRLRKPQARCA